MFKGGSIFRLRIGVIDPLADVIYALQPRNGDLDAPVKKMTGALWFEIVLRLGASLANGQLNFLGDSACGPSSDRFLYINSGQRAGQAQSIWNRRAKIKLASLPATLV